MGMSLRVLSRKSKHKQMFVRMLKQYVRENPFSSTYTWVKAHQDDTMEWDQMTQMEQLNCRVDKLAKKALIAVVVSQDYIKSYFPFEQIRVVVGGTKITASPTTALAKHWAYNTAKKLYHENELIHKNDFHLVWWDGVEKVLLSFPTMFRVWLTKHVAKCCATNRQLARIDKSVKNVCPSCGR